MSQINEELQRQMNADIGEAFKKVFGESTPTIDYDKERLRFLEDRIRQEEEKARAESAKR